MRDAPEKIYRSWCRNVRDRELSGELKSMKDDQELIKESFYKDLEFGTAGLRGVIGAGTNRMNIYTVAKASRGLANYVINHFAEQKRSIAISYDSRIKSDLFAKTAAGVFAAAGIKTYIFPTLNPTPCLSYAVRHLKCSAGVMVTASHNPAKYNGYKVYGKDGCQITSGAANEILSEIEKLDTFEGLEIMPFEEGLASHLIEYTDEKLDTCFINCVKRQSVLSKNDKIDRNVSIVYTPLNGTGLVPVLRVLKETGFTNVKVVEEQRMPDGNFPTCPYPNPEIREAMALGIEYARKYDADILVATDPDCDRVGIAVKDRKGEFILFSGNEVGVLLTDFICRKRIENGKMPDDPVLVKSIVTTDMAEKVAAGYGVRTINVLTGFKYIGEQIHNLEKKKKGKSYVFGFEESYGYLSGKYVRDKDAVDGAFLICEMFAYYRTAGISLLDKLDEIYKKYGYMRHTVYSYQFEGIAGQARMKEIMSLLRSGIDSIGGRKVLSVLDYAKGINGLPASEVLQFRLEGDASLIVRPSGTEPKIKAYITVNEKTRSGSEKAEKPIKDFADSIMK